MTRLRLQFGLRGLLILTTVVGMGLAYLGARLRAGSKQASLEAELAARGGIVYFESSSSEWLPAGWRARLGWRVPVGVVGPGIDDEALQLVGQLRGLRVLRLEGTKITDAGLAHLRGLSTVEYLELAGTGIGDAGLKSVAALSALNTLKLGGTRVSDEGLVHLAPLEKLEHLEFEGAPVTHAGCLRVFVDLQGRSVAEGLAVIGLAHRDDKELLSIVLSGPHGTPRLIHYLQRMPALHTVVLSAPMPSLAVLDELRNLPDLERAWIDDTFDERMAAAISSLQLEEVNIRGRQWTDESARAFAGLTRAASMDLSGSSITAAGLANFRNLQGLKSLRLYGAPVGDEGLRHIACLTELRILDLSATQVSDAGLVYLRNLPALEFLQLNGTKVTDQGLQSLRDHPRLRGVHTEQTSVSAAAQQSFRQGRPDREEFDPLRFF